MGIVILILSFLADEGYIENLHYSTKKITAPTLAT